MVKDKCPHCRRLECIPEVALNNVETYGSETGGFNVPCNHCDRMIHIILARYVEVIEIEKSDVPVEEQDFSIAFLENLGK